MKIPGFTAEVSIYKTGECYRTVGSREQIGEAIHPAQSLMDQQVAMQPGPVADEPIDIHGSTTNVLQPGCHEICRVETICLSPPYGSGCHRRIGPCFRLCQ